MKGSKFALAVAACIVGMAMVGALFAACSTTNVITGGDQIIIGADGGLTHGPGVGTSKGPVSKVEIKGIVNGEHCEAGATPANATKTIGVRCYLDITVNPLDPAGTVIYDTTITGPSPESFKELGESGAASFFPASGNPYNGRISCRAVGTIVLEAQVKGVKSDPTTFTCK